MPDPDPRYGLTVDPATLTPDQSRTVRFFGRGTRWRTNPPYFSPGGALGIITLGPLTVHNDTRASMDVLYPPASVLLPPPVHIDFARNATALVAVEYPQPPSSTISWNDSTTGAVATQTVEVGGDVAPAAGPAKKFPMLRRR